MYPILQLLPKHDRRIKQGHLWVYSNEVDVKKTPLKNFQIGETVKVVNAQGKFMGYGYVNPGTLICARLLSRHENFKPSEKLISKRLESAAEMRERYFASPFFRLCYGDSDGLPGLVIDRFGDYFVVQITTQGMEQWKSEIINVLEKLFSPQGILFKNDSSSRAVEGLESYVELGLGDFPEEMPVIEGDVEFIAPIKSGQKTGWFYDHRANRQTVARWANGARVLDVYSYIGAWGLQSLAAGADQLFCIDASELALNYVAKSAKKNGFDEKVVQCQGKAFQVMSELRQEGEKFDMVILDPPAFIKKKKDFDSGLTAYRRGIELAIRLLRQGGVLVSASCSMHLQESQLLDLMRSTSRHLDRQLQIVHTGGQDVDHPVHPSIPETRYIKSITSRVLSAW